MGDTGPGLEQVILSSQCSAPWLSERKMFRRLEGRGEGQVWLADMLLLHSNSNSQLSSIMLNTSIYIFQSHLGKIECGNHH